MENAVATPILSGQDRDSFIFCRNSQGTPVRGSLMHFSPQNAIFEVYNPFSILQLSEVLSDFKIMIGERVLYAGRAVVSSLVNTGIMLVSEVTLVDPWSDVDIFSLLQDRNALQAEVQRFVCEWSSKNDVLPEFKVLTSDFQGFLADLSLWLKQIEVGLTKTVGPRVSDEFQQDFVERLIDPIRPAAFEFLERLETLAEQIPMERVGAHKAYIRRDLHPLTLCSPFVHRSFTKPLGYAGDFEMISMLLERPYEGRTLFAKTINKLFTDSAPAEAHRNRIKILKSMLDQEVNRVVNDGKRFEVLNIGCGPAKEVRDFITSHPPGTCQLTLMDFSKEALSYARQKISEAKSSSNSEIEVNFIEKSIDELLRQAINPEEQRKIGSQKFDFVYCAGLFDYLTDSICRRLIFLFYEWLLPGGLLCVTNIHPANPQKHLMEFLLEWNVIHRNEIQFKNLGIPDREQEVVADDTGVNIFLKIRKPF